jgi:four helix bundle protein
MGKKGFKDLLVWQRAKNLAISVYRLSSKDLRVDNGLRTQIQRSAVSIASNIAEGDERHTDKEAVRFFFVAKGSLAELRTQLQIAYESGHLTQSLYDDLEAECVILGKMLGSLIRARDGRYRA